MHFDVHVYRRFLKGFGISVTSFSYFQALLLPRKFFTTRIKAFHASSLLFLSRAEVNCLIKPNLMWWKEYLVSVYERRANDVLHRPVLFCVMLSSVPTIPHAQKAWVTDEAGLLPQQKLHHLQVNTNKPLMLIITTLL